MKFIVFIINSIINFIINFVIKNSNLIESFLASLHYEC